MKHLEQHSKTLQIINKYLFNIKRLSGRLERQHFLSRLALCPGYESATINKRIYETAIKKLSEILAMTDETYWETALHYDSNGYLKEIDKVVTPDIKRYFRMTAVFELTTVLLRNEVELESDIEESVQKLLSRYNTTKFLEISKNEDLMKYEGTICVNGVGYLRELKIRTKWVKITLNVINERLLELFNYYIEATKQKINHHSLYGLTHCVINCSLFYTTPIDLEDPDFADVLTLAGNRLESILLQSKSNYFKNISSDALAEILLTLKLLQKDNTGVWLNAYDALAGRFDSGTGIIPSRSDSNFSEMLVKCEHTNILFILCGLL